MRCVQSACDLVESLAWATKQDATGAWWYGVFCEPFPLLIFGTLLLTNLDLISAGIILVSADLSGISFDTLEKNQREGAWDQCLDTLHRMVDVHPSARDYAIALDGLKQRHSFSVSQSKIASAESTHHHNNFNFCFRPRYQKLTIFVRDR